MTNLVLFLFLALSLPAIAEPVNNEVKVACTNNDYATVQSALINLEIRTGKKHKNAVLQTLQQTNTTCQRIFYKPRIGVPGRKRAHFEVAVRDLLYRVTIINDMESRSRWVTISRTRQR